MSAFRWTPFALLLLLAAAAWFPVSAAASEADTRFLSDDPADRKSTIPHDPVMAEAVAGSDLRMVAVQHEGWTETFTTFSRIKLYELTGRMRISGQTPAYSVLSMMYEPAKWDDARIFPLGHPRLLDYFEIEGKWISASEITESPRLNDLITALEAAQERRDRIAELEKVLGAIEQVHRLGREERVLRQYESDPDTPITQIELEFFLDNPAQVTVLHEERAELRKVWDDEKPFFEAGNRLLNRVMVLRHLREEMLVVPDTEAAVEQWVVPVSFTGDTGQTIFEAGRIFDGELERAFATRNPDLLREATTSFLRVAERSRMYPAENFRRAMNIYVETNPYWLSAWIYLLSAALFGLFTFFGHRGFYWPALGGMGLGFLVLTGALGIRLYLKGHVPVSNMFEAITFFVWCVLAIALVIEAIQRRALVGVGSTIVAFLFLVGAALMPLHETRIQPLRAVLNSYWLNIHVTMMLVSYAAFAIATFFAILYFVRSLAPREALWGTFGSAAAGGAFIGVYQGVLAFEVWLKSGIAWLNMLFETVEIFCFLIGGILLIIAGVLAVGWGIRWVVESLGLISGGPPMTMEQNEEFAYRLVQLGWPILTLGITLGAVWADVAWGRFWGWDPKETWAFITWVTYTVYLHMRMVMGWRGRWSAAACIIGFVMVLITWLGVSYLPWFSGGLHSYASPTG